MLRRLKAFVEPRQTLRFTALLFALLCSSAYGFAKEITPNKALAIAKRYITPAVVTQKSRATRATSAAASTPFISITTSVGRALSSFRPMMLWARC